MASYDQSYWRRLTKSLEPCTLMGTLSRMVENQEQTVTVQLVDDLHEHQLLEQMLEDSKPDIAPELEHFDYLLRSPWRYPPLPWGSRFGRRHEPGIFYGSLGVEALFAEAAFYRFVFIEGLTVPFEDRVISRHSVFEARYQSNSGIDLTKPPFARCSKELTHRSDYSACQSLGTVLREEGIQALIFQSARTPTEALNIALLAPKALRSKKHLRLKRGLCETYPNTVTFQFDGVLRTYQRRQFVHAGHFPMPA